ncbi:MAG: HRDC domain-containing protein [Desulfobacterales bacterium]
MTDENVKFNFNIIETEKNLKAVVPELNKSAAIAIDLEADSMFNFKEKVCLIQMAVPGMNLVVDTLKVNNLSALKPLFSNRSIQKIFHGADYDIRSLFRDFGIEVNNLFDTELACRFLGIRETGLDSVLRDRFNVNVDKRFQKKDWSRRPLPKEMVDYAARDAVHLISLAGVLQQELQKKGRLAWVNEECKLLSRVRSIFSENEPLFVKCKGAGRLDPRSLAVLEELLKFRLKAAEKKNRPVFKIMSTLTLHEISRGKPIAVKQLQKLQTVSSKQIGMYGEQIIAAVKRGLKVPEKRLPVYPRMRSPILKPEIPGRVKAIKEWRDSVAGELEIDPTMLFNKALMTAIAVQKPDNLKSLGKVEGIRNWQRKEFGRNIIEILNRQN